MSAQPMNIVESHAAAHPRQMRAARCRRETPTPAPTTSMRVVCKRARRCAGASLLEVLVAVSLLASSLLGLAAAQLTALRDADAQARRAHASWMAASIAETMRVPALAAPMLERSRASIEKLVPGARIAFADGARDIGTIVVQWASTPSAQKRVHERVQSPATGPCAFAAHHAAVHCIMQPFVPGGA